MCNITDMICGPLRSDKLTLVNSSQTCRQISSSNAKLLSTKAHSHVLSQLWILCILEGIMDAYDQSLTTLLK